jgi:hypothetical protein
METMLDRKTLAYSTKEEITKQESFITLALGRKTLRQPGCSKIFFLSAFKLFPESTFTKIPEQGILQGKVSLYH